MPLPGCRRRGAAALHPLPRGWGSNSGPMGSSRGTDRTLPASVRPIESGGGVVKGRWLAPQVKPTLPEGVSRRVPGSLRLKSDR